MAARRARAKTSTREPGVSNRRASGRRADARLGLVALRPFGLELADDFVVAVGGGLRRPQGVAAGMRPIRRAAANSRRRPRRDRAPRRRRWRAPPALRPPSAASTRATTTRVERALGSGKRLDGLGEPVEGEGFAGAGRARDRGEERRLHLRDHAELPSGCTIAPLPARPRLRRRRTGRSAAGARAGSTRARARGVRRGGCGQRGRPGRLGSPSRRILAVWLISDTQTLLDALRPFRLAGPACSPSGPVRVLHRSIHSEVKWNRRRATLNACVLNSFATLRPCRGSTGRSGAQSPGEAISGIAMVSRAAANLSLTKEPDVSLFAAPTPDAMPIWFVSAGRLGER